MGVDSSAYFRDVQDHLRRLAVRADSQRERLTGAVHLADNAWKGGLVSTVTRARADRAKR